MDAGKEDTKAAGVEMEGAGSRMTWRKKFAVEKTLEKKN